MSLTYKDYKATSVLQEMEHTLRESGFQMSQFRQVIESIRTESTVKKIEIRTVSDPALFYQEVGSYYWSLIEGNMAGAYDQLWDVAIKQVVAYFYSPTNTLHVMVYEPDKVKIEDTKAWWEMYQSDELDDDRIEEESVSEDTSVYDTHTPARLDSTAHRQNWKRFSDNDDHNYNDRILYGTDEEVVERMAALLVAYPELRNAVGNGRDSHNNLTNNCDTGTARWLKLLGVSDMQTPITLQDVLKHSALDHALMYPSYKTGKAFFFGASAYKDISNIEEWWVNRDREAVMRYIEEVKQVPYSNANFGSPVQTFDYGYNDDEEYYDEIDADYNTDDEE